MLEANLSEGFMPHGHCYLWRPGLLALHAGSDALITLAYLTIPLLLLRFLRQRRDLPFRGLFVAFMVFIISCGLTHALEVWTLWTPAYWLAGGVKAVTAAASLATAAMLVPMLPRAVALPSPAQLQRANASLAAANVELASANQRAAQAVAQLELQRLVVQHMRDGLLLVRARDNVVVFVNPHLERMLGYPPGELLGMSSRGLYALEGSPAAEELRARARRAFEAGLELEYEATLRQRDGGALWCRGVSTAFEHPEHGRVQMSLFRERTEEMRALLADIVLSTTEAVVAVSPEGLVLTWNAGAQKLYGYGEAEAVGRPFAELTGAQAQTPEGAAPLVHDAAHRTRDGRVLDVVVTVSPIRTGAGALVALSKLIHDVTEARKAQRALAASLADKEVLLQEVHHRVKNNLQVVASLLRLQSEALLSDEAKEAFLETHERVRAIAMLHEVLYRSKSLGRIPLQEYALELVRSVARAHQLPGEPVELEVTAGPVLLSVETGVPLSLILNELLSNSFKHAFPQPRPSGVPARAVRVEVEQAQGSLEVLVADTGVGLPPGFSLEQGTGVGLQVVRSLVRQLKGTLVAEAGPGARWRLKFPNATGVSG